MKEVHGNVWKTGVIVQSAKQPDSYWIKFPDSSILKRTHQMIKPRSLLSHFELETQSKEWDNSQFIPSSASRNFQPMLPDTEQPALPTGNPVTPAFHEKGISSMRQDIATDSSSSVGVQPSISVRRSTRSTKGVLPRRFSPSRTEKTIWNFVEHSGRSFVLNNNQQWLFLSIQLLNGDHTDTHLV